MTPTTPTPTTGPSASPASTVNLAARQRFQLSPDNLRKHRDMIETHEFQRGTDFAMLDTAAFLAATVKDDESAKAAGHALRGAHEFLYRLKMLAEVPKSQPKIVDMGNLNHERQ
jgi:hypothetical protein